MLTQRMHAQQRQQAALSPRLQHAVRLLQMSSLEFAQELQHALSANPFLQTDDADTGVVLPDVADSGNPGDPRTGGDAAASASADEGEGAPTPDDCMRWEAPRGTQPASEGFSALDLVPSEASLQAHLHTQIALLPLPQRDALLARAVIESLDDDGYLRGDLEGLVDADDELAPVEPAEWRIALARVQALDPPGVGARSVQECLLLQLGAIEDPVERALARRILQHHLQALAGRRIEALARDLGQPVDTVAAACARIRHLHPRPGWRVGGPRSQYVTPDVIVKKRQGRWHVSLNPAIVPRLRLNEAYAALVPARDDATQGLAVQLREARWTLRNVEQRFSTILSVAQAIVDRQHAFFEHGVIGMKPLILREIAEELQVHTSTVSRVTNNKFIAAPAGVFELKYFFSRPMPMEESDGTFSGKAIRAFIKEMIAEERVDKPLSDAEIGRRLVAQGLRVSRRTVTKYRQALSILPVHLRRGANDGLPGG